MFDDVDVAETAAEAIAGAGLYNAGQDCTAACRVLVHEDVHDEFVAALAEAAANTGPVTVADEDATSARSTTPSQLARVTGFIDRVPGHAEVLTGGNRIGDRGFFFAPTMVAGLKQDDEMVQDEVFGPVITVQTFSDEAEAVALGQRRAVRPAPARCGPPTTAGRCGCRAASTSAWCGSTPTSRSSPRCRTAASSTPATARTCPFTGFTSTPASST